MPPTGLLIAAAEALAASSVESKKVVKRMMEIESKERTSLWRKYNEDFELKVGIRRCFEG